MKLHDSVSRLSPGLTRLVLLSAALATGCPGDDTPSATSDGSSTGDAEDTTDGGTLPNPTTVDDTGTDSSGGGMCGDGVVDAGEDCDGSDLGAADCTTEGFLGGDLACAADCTFDISACTDVVCGDGAIGGDEECDGDDLGGNDCVALGMFDEGTLACAADCTYDTSMCVMYSCGNDTLEGMETCDGTDLAGEDCISQGFDGGTLACQADCLDYDATGCFACGDDVIGGTEVCDGVDLGGQDCTTQGFDGGTLACAADCSGLDTSGCFTCGDGMIGGPEECDGADLGGETCATQGFVFGTLACDAGCGFDTSGCTNSMCSAPALPIGPDQGTLTVDTIAVPALPDFVTDVNVFIDASHTYVGDMDIDVRHVESNTIRRLIQDQCDTDEDLLASFDMGGVGLDCALPPPVGQGGAILPTQSLHAYTGIPVGPTTWELTILDDAFGDGGTLNEWCVEFTVGPNNETCGDGIVTFGEGCDDGGVMVGDGCSDTCSVEPGFACAGEPSMCAASPVFGLRFTEMSIGNDYVDITNPTGAAISLAGLNIFFDDSSFTDFTFVFPVMDILPGQTLRVFEPGGAGDVPTGSNIFFDPGRGGAAILCNGVCASAADVIDVVAFSEGEPHAPLPVGVTFSPAGLNGIVDQFTQVYSRAAFAGAAPNFLAADWTIL
jgi:cysteine-rich repeat protein